MLINVIGGMKYRILILLFFSVGNLLANEDSTLVAREKQLELLLNELRLAENDAVKSEKNSAFKDYLFETLQHKDAFTYPFSKLRTVGFIDSPDKLVRIINWNVEQDDETQMYYCFILHVDERKKKVEISELTDNSFMLPPRPDGILDASDWYGALYYKIIPMEKSGKTIYTLLGWDGNNSMSSIKLIDALYFSGDHPKLGSPIFKTTETTQKRVFFEHSKKATMSLKYEEQYDRIIFDHLSPEAPNLKGFYSFYVPDLSYDAMVLEGNKWILKEDVIGINPEPNEKTTIFVKNERTGEVEEKEIKNKWENPEDEGAPGGGSEHVAVTPDQDLNNPVAQKNVQDKKISKRDKRDVENMGVTLGKGTKPKKRKS